MMSSFKGGEILNAANVQMFQPMQKQSFMKDKTQKSSSNFNQLMKQSFMSQQSSVSDSKKSYQLNKIKQFLKEEGISNDDLKQLLKKVSDLFNSGEDSQSILEQLSSENVNFLEGLLNLFNHDLELDQLVHLFEDLLDEDDSIILTETVNHLMQLLAELQSTLDTSDDSDEELKVENIVIDELINLEGLSEIEMIQLLQQLQSVMDSLKQGEALKKVAQALLPLLNEWDAMNKQNANRMLNELAAKYLEPEDLEVLKQVKKLYDKRTHFHSKQVYGESATVTRSDIAQWVKAALSQSQNQEQTSRVIPTFNNETMTMPRMTVVNQQAIHNFSHLESVQRIEADMAARITNTIQQHMSLQQRGPLQSLNMVLTPEHLGTLQVNFSQVNGEMIVRIIASSGYAKDMLETNLHQLKHAFSPHQVQVIRGDDTVIEEEVFQQQEEENEDNQDHENEQEESNKEETIVLDFSTLFEEILMEEEVEISD